MERPNFKEIFGTDKKLKNVHKSIINEPELFKYAQQLDLYIDYLEDKFLNEKNIASQQVIRFCPNCFQITNHINGICQKCKQLQ